ncbi:MAG: class I SAM-dependent methyltransferase [Bacteroidales bacterium]|nr:class I SAM-dependent methyltransferase [Bacteroidales bacterium]
MDIKELNVNVEKESTQNHPWEYARARVIDCLLRRYIKKKSADGYVADVGCGDIFFVHQFVCKHSKLKAAAVDIAFNDDIIASLKAKYSDQEVLFFNDIQKVDLNGKPAKIVFLMDVLEHIEDDVTFLKTLVNSDFVNGETLFMITVPAFNSLYCSHDKWLGHYRRYDRKMLGDCIKSAGLKSETDGYFFTSILLPRWLKKMVESHQKEETEVTGIGGWNGGKLVSKVYEWILLADFYFFRIFRIFGVKMPGLSTYAICKLQ